MQHVKVQRLTPSSTDRCVWPECEARPELVISGMADSNNPAAYHVTYCQAHGEIIEAALLEHATVE